MKHWPISIDMKMNGSFALVIPCSFWEFKVAPGLGLAFLPT